MRASSPAPPYPLNAYHDVDGAGHQARFKTLYAQGYRVISFSVYGDAADPRYAAVWLKRMGPPWTMIHGANAAQMQQFFTAWAAKGYNPTIISATGTGDSTVFALVMERTTGPGTQSTSVSKDNLRRGDPYTQDPTQDTLEYWNRWARDPKTRKQHGHYFRLRWLTVYGNPADPRFAAIWEPDQSAVTWNGGLAPLTLADAQSIYNAESAQWGRLAFVTRSYDGQYMQLYRDDLIGPTAARGDLTSAGYQAQFTTLVGQGYYPICVQGSGPTADPRFAAIFVNGESPAARVWTARGSAPAPTIDVAAPAIDAAIQVFMQANGVRGAALNVATANPILQPDTITAMLKGQYGWDSMSPIGGGAYQGVKGGYLPGLQSSVSFTSGGVSYVVYWNKDRLQEGQFYPSFPELEAAIAATTFAAPDLFPVYNMPSL